MSSGEQVVRKLLSNEVLVTRVQRVRVISMLLEAVHVAAEVGAVGEEVVAAVEQIRAGDAQEWRRGVAAFLGGKEVAVPRRTLLLVGALSAARGRGDAVAVGVKTEREARADAALHAALRGLPSRAFTVGGIVDLAIDVATRLAGVPEPSFSAVADAFVAVASSCGARAVAIADVREGGAAFMTAHALQVDHLPFARRFQAAVVHSLISSVGTSLNVPLATRTAPAHAAVRAIPMAATIGDSVERAALLMASGCVAQAHFVAFRAHLRSASSSLKDCDAWRAFLDGEPSVEELATYVSERRIGATVLSGGGSAWGGSSNGGAARRSPSKAAAPKQPTARAFHAVTERLRVAELELAKGNPS